MGESRKQCGVTEGDSLRFLLILCPLVDPTVGTGFRLVALTCGSYREDRREYCGSRAGSDDNSCCRDR